PALLAAGGAALLQDADAYFRFFEALERRRAEAPDDPDVARFRPFLYDRLTLAAYEDRLAGRPTASLDWLDYAHCHTLGIEQARRPKDEEARPGATASDRAIELLRLAEYGLPARRLSLWQGLARLYGRTDLAASNRWYERIKEWGREKGVKNLAADEKDAFYDAVRVLAEDALAVDDVPAAIDALTLFSTSERSGLDTLRALQKLHERQGDLPAAIKTVETSLQYGLDDKRRREQEQEKERLYGAIDPAVVQARAVEIERFFDFDYCFRRAKAAFERDEPDAVRWLDVAGMGGTAQLLPVNYLLGRTHLRRGDDRTAADCFEAVRAAKPASFRSNDEEEAYFHALRLLGDVYLDRLDDPEKAVECYQGYRNYVKSGAETLYRLGSAYERLGQTAAARKWYDMVLVYPQHPRAGDAQAALARLAAV
ncbi:MAG: tetratricopeptide repeat protein, partial [Planctomycetia bacterium]